MGTFRLPDARIVSLVESQHLPHHPIVFGNRVPGHLCTPGDDTVICLVRMKPQVFPDLPVFLGELIR